MAMDNVLMNYRNVVLPFSLKGIKDKVEFSYCIVLYCIVQLLYCIVDHVLSFASCSRQKSIQPANVFIPYLQQ